ncbi:MAG: NADP-dependent oxidoreductase, partial [Gammaproteobacteria bacterium]|nr:NADP-dependent oxidoreductase [Gammaproteobacteria bacterium]
VSSFTEQQPQFLKDMSGWIKRGQVQFHETVFNGIEKAPEAFMGLFNGTNDGKMLVKLADA